MLGNQDAAVTVNIAGKNLSILVDSGASVNAIDHTLFNQLKFSNTILEKSNAKIYPYGKTTSLDLVGKATFSVKVSNGAKIRNRYNQVPHLTQDTNGKVTNSQKTPQTRAKRSALSQQVTTKHNKQTRTKHSKHKTEQKHKRSTKEVPPWNGQ